MSHTGLQFFVGFSLVDITATGVTRGDNNSLERNQQRNWETLLQCIGLRTQPHNIQYPVAITANLDDYEFGELYTGTHKIWQWVWSVESLDVYDLPNKSLGGLHGDLEQVPIVTYLTDTARFMLPIFYPYGTIKNIYVKKLNNG